MMKDNIVEIEEKKDKDDKLIELYEVVCYPIIAFLFLVLFMFCVFTVVPAVNMIGVKVFMDFDSYSFFAYYPTLFLVDLGIAALFFFVFKRASKMLLNFAKKHIHWVKKKKKEKKPKVEKGALNNG